MNNVFEITLDDGNKVLGGTIEDPEWRELRLDQKIKSLKIKLCEQDCIVLSEYEQYNFFIGARKFSNRKQPVISHLYGLGRNGKTVTSYRITVVSSSDEKYKVGDITMRIFPFGSEGMGRTATSGWKKGITEEESEKK